MLRPRPDGAVDLDVQAVPRSSRDAIGKPHGDRLKLHIKSPPVDGEANAALLRLLAKTLGVPREAIELTQGHTGKRKTVRIHGLALAEITARLGLACTLAGLFAVGPACESPRELPITVILPADDSGYERANNATVIMRPSGDSFSFAVDGLDFRLELEGEPTSTTQQLELYLADGEQLIAWGSTAGFSTAGPDVGLALFLGRPGLLSTWPDTLDTPDPNVLASEALGRGMLLVETDGDTFLLNHYTLELESGERLPAAVSFSGDDGGLFSAADGSVVRLAFEQVEPLAWRYDPASDAWSELTISLGDASADIGLRPGAAMLVDPDRSRVYLLGGGGATDAIAIDLVADGDGTLAAASVSSFELDVPRDHATALWIPQADNPTADVLLVGADPGADGMPGAPGPIAALASTGMSFGPSLDWRDLACTIESTSTVLCVGGTLDGLPTADALRIEIAAGAATVERLANFLPAPLPDPRLFQDAFAVYAQGDGRWFRVSRDGGDVSEPESAALRGTGGSCVALANGVTFLVGGADQDGAALDRWQVFTPAIEP